MRFLRRGPSGNGHAAPWSGLRPLKERIEQWDGQSELKTDDDAEARDGLRFAPGAIDGLATHHQRLEMPDGKHAVDAVVDSFKRLVRSDEDAARRAFYRSLLAPIGPEDVDQILERIAARGFDRAALRDRARWLLEVSAHAAPAKVGLAILGISGRAEDTDLLMLFARHDEFTLYSAVAASNLLPDPVDVWWKMAQNVHGWGKVQLVERLAQKIANRSDIKAWILRDGIANSVLDEYLALICARAGDLAEALAQPEIDGPLLNGACRLLSALYMEGPTAGISEYEDGVVVVERLLTHLEREATSLEHLECVADTRRWLQWPAPAIPPDDVLASLPVSAEEIKKQSEAAWAQRERLGWTDGKRSELATRCDAVLAWPKWAEVVRSTFTTNSSQAIRAFTLAPAIGIDVWEAGFEQLERDPLDQGWYYYLLRSRDPARTGRVVSFAERHLPLDQIAIGPKRDLGLGPEFRAHSCLDFVVQEMKRPDVWSPRLVAVALRSPVIRNRNMAINALKMHRRAEWSDELVSAIGRTLDDEPDPKVRESLSSATSSH